ncbi:SRPBCC family protein [Crossiella sp. SN42]|uniref:SRPBCC family protein n=1 Tax=Crossiella sp. SN42 TaxID=2944808 RepID=UPI00207C3C0A|nr:SRPBCC family protein [Crossiella sp. SN42]MCO1580343.1 SRPBCC family protein [Crossiella sp. SN42]
MAARTENTVLVQAPMDLVWRMTNDVASWPELFSEYAAAEILEQGENRVRFRLTTHPDEAGRTWSWVSERHSDPASRTVRAERVETGPFEYMRIHWDYTEVDGGVRLRWVQDFAMKPAAPVDDAGMAERINRNTPVQQRRIKEIVERAAKGEG